MAQRFSSPPSLDDLAALAESALATIPAALRAHVGDVVLRVDDFPDAEVERDMALESPFDLLGLYRGVSLLEKSPSAVLPQVDMIFLYRRPLLDYWCETGEELAAVVRHVLIHEIGHHFGFSDDDMDALEQDG
jgi:predicted Zn-dependent protease with MMP-like domain